MLMFVSWTLNVIMCRYFRYARIQTNTKKIFKKNKKQKYKNKQTNNTEINIKLSNKQLIK